MIAHDQRWTGAIERFDDSELDVSADLGGLIIGGNRMIVRPDGYQVLIDLPGQNIQGELNFASVSRPFVVNNQPVGEGRMSWLFVPRLRADGWLRIGDQEHRIDSEVAYHDHNWGRFWWGDDFGWTWGTVLAQETGEPVVAGLPANDRPATAALPVAGAVRVAPRRARRDIQTRRSADALARQARPRPADCTLPAPMRLLLDGEVSDVPERIEINATRAGDAVHAEFRPQSYARLAQPSEVSLNRSSVLCETSGTAQVSGSINGEGIDFVGAGVFEFLYG